MKIAILSDTHDNAPNTRAALALLAAHAPAAYIHCGDLCSPEMLLLFAGLPLYFVFGNNDYDHAGLKAQAHALGLHCLGSFGDLTLAGKKIAILHGDDLARRRLALESGTFDYLLLGHTHHRLDARPTRRTREINPGALYRAAEKSVALLDLATDTLHFILLSPPSTSPFPAPAPP